MTTYMTIMLHMLPFILIAAGILKTIHVSTLYRAAKKCCNCWKSQCCITACVKSEKHNVYLFFVKDN